jgi:hypothetical protein
MSDFIRNFALLIVIALASLGMGVVLYSIQEWWRK